MASQNGSEDANDTGSKQKSSPWETMDSDNDAPMNARPPVPPSNSKTRAHHHGLHPSAVSRGGEDSSIGSHSSGVYVRADGKKVRRIRKKRSGSAGSSVATSSDEETLTVGSMSIGSDVYIRADGKKVRRVKRKSKKKQATNDIPTQVSISSPTAADAPTAFMRGSTESQVDSRDTTDEQEADMTISTLGTQTKTQEETTTDATNNGDKADAVIPSSEKEEVVATMGDKVNEQPMTQQIAKVPSKQDYEPKMQQNDSNEEHKVVSSDVPTTEAVILSSEKEEVASSDQYVDEKSTTQQKVEESGDSGHDISKSEETSEDQPEEALPPTLQGGVPEREVDEKEVPGHAASDPDLCSSAIPTKTLDAQHSKEPLVETESATESDAMNPWLVEPTDLEVQSAETKSEEKSGGSFEKFMTQIESAETLTEERSVNTFEEFVTDIESAEVSKETKRDDSFEEFVAKVESAEVNTEKNRGGSFEEFIAQIESTEVKTEGEGKCADSLEEFVPQVESVDGRNGDQMQPYEEFVIVDKQVEAGTDPAISINSTAPDCAPDHIMPNLGTYNASAHDTVRSPSIDQQRGTIQPGAPDRFTQFAQRSKTPDRYGTNIESPVEDKDNLSYNFVIGTMGAASQSAVHMTNTVGTVTEQPPLTSVGVLGSQSHRTPHAPPVGLANTESFGSGSLDAYPSAEAVSPKARGDDESEGGKLWQEASREAQSPPAPASTPKRRQLPETLMERTRSRADVDAFVTPRTPMTPNDPSSKCCC